MTNLLKLAARNLMRYRRRTLLTSTLIVIGVVAVLTFMGVSGSFKNMMVGMITDSMLGHFQVHRKGYVASIDSLPLNLNMSAPLVARMEEALKSNKAVVAYSHRVKFGAMFSNFAETTSIRVNGVDPAAEAATTPLLPGRARDIPRGEPLLVRGEILVPVLLARGLAVKAGDEVVLIAIVLVSVMNVMVMAVYERIREIGTVAAIGTPPGKILGLFLSEGLLLGIVGCIAGIVVSAGVLYGLNAAELTFAFGQQSDLPLRGTMHARDVVQIGSMVIAVAVVASLQPAWTASRMDPIIALRHV